MSVGAGAVTALAGAGGSLHAAWTALAAGTYTGRTRAAFEHVESIYFPIAIGVFALICAILALFLVMGWRRKQAGGKHEANLLEGSYALLLACFVAGLTYVTFTTLDPEDERVAHPGTIIKVVAARWTWRFEYPGGATVVAAATWNPPAAPVPVNTEVEFEGTSQDVIHGFWVPEERFMRQLLPGYTTRFDLVFEHPGSYMGECSVFCGDEHEFMHFLLKAVSPAQYKAWLSENAGKVIS